MLRRSILVLVLTLGMFIVVSKWNSHDSNAERKYFKEDPSRPINFEYLKGYYKRETAGVVFPNPALEKIQTLTSKSDRDLKLMDWFQKGREITFKLEKDPPQAFVSVKEVHPHLIQEIFETDVKLFSKQYESPDFLGAVRRFHSLLDYDPEYQLYSRPYHYLESWGVLFHPPIKWLRHPLHVYVKDFAPLDIKRDPFVGSSKFFVPKFQEKIDQLTGTELSYGNKVKLLPNYLAFQEKLRLIRDAKKWFHGAVMFIGPDESTMSLVNEMIRKAQQRVDVRLLVERFYGISFSATIIERLRKGGVHVEVVGDGTDLTGGSIGSMMHNKMWIRDGEEMVIGGQNVVNVENRSTGFNGMNRDEDALVSGPTVADAQGGYNRLWKRVTGREELAPFEEWVAETKAVERREGRRGVKHYSNWLSNVETRMNGVCRFALQDKKATYQPIGPMIEEHLKESRRNIFLTTPDIGPDDVDLKSNDHYDRVMKLLLGYRKQYAPQVTLITNGQGGGLGETSMFFEHLSSDLRKEHGDGHVLGELSGQYARHIARYQSRDNRERAIWLQKSNSNLKAWQYFQYIHAKLYLFDRIASFVSSWNLDRQSSDKNHELGLMCLDDSLRQQLEQRFVVDLINSEPVASANGY